MMTDKTEKGNKGEALAADFLIKKGFEVVERNYRHKHAEIDLIVKKANWLIFVEVKARSSTAFGHPETFVDREKVKKILEGADHYIFETDWQGNVRYDIVSVLFKYNNTEIYHIEDAFY
jgi:putative endonuclease